MDKKKEYIVYVHINKENDKKYVGITSQEPKRRWKNGWGYYSKNGTPFWNAIQKYSWDGFDHIILFEGLSLDEANEKEREYIELYKSFDKSFGYNCTLGGDGFLGLPRSEETKRKLSESLKGKYTGENSYWFGKKLPKETIEKQKETKRINKYHHTDEWKKKHSENMSGENNPNSTKVVCVNTKEVFVSAVAAAKYYKSDNSLIGKCCKGKAKSAGKHPETGESLQWMYYEDYLKTDYDKEHPRTEIYVEMLD